MLYLFLSVVDANPIVNGQLEAGFPSTVSLGAEFGGNAFSSCTGNLITPRIILSAAHCGDRIPIDIVLEFGKAFIGNSVSSYETSLEFADMNVHPDYEELEGTIGGSLGANDFSLLVLEEEAPVQPTLFRHAPLTEEQHFGTQLTSVGFGITGEGQNDSGVKRSTELTLDSLDEMFIISNSNTNPNQANICSGDSGGPMFYYNESIGEYIQWAVHSWGDSTCQYQSGSTRTDLVVDWIYETVEAVHGSRDICEINGYYDDDECTEMDVCSGIDPACIEEEKGILACSTSPLSSSPIWLLPLLLYTRRK